MLDPRRSHIQRTILGRLNCSIKRIKSVFNFDLKKNELYPSGFNKSTSAIFSGQGFLSCMLHSTTQHKYGNKRRSITQIKHHKCSSVRPPFKDILLSSNNAEIIKCNPNGFFRCSSPRLFRQDIDHNTQRC